MILIVSDLTKEKKLLNSNDWIFRFDAVIKTESIDYLVDVVKKHPDIQPIIFIPSFNVFEKQKKLKEIYERLIVLFERPSVPAAIINAKIPIRYAFEIHPVEDKQIAGKKSYISINTTKRDVQINTDNFLYVETVKGKHKVAVHSYSQTSEFAGSINKIEKDNFDNLIRISSSYLVNDSKITEINTTLNIVKLESGEELPYSRNNKKKIENLLNER